jgi:nickel/cobalt transporter (NicO) family protein
MSTLLLSALTVALFHALAPDHWLPFVALARDANWSVRRLTWVSALAALGHVISSLALGGIALWAGFALIPMENAEAWRGTIGLTLLIGFGIAYTVWGIKRARERQQDGERSARDALRGYAKRRMWMLFAILVFGPCEPLIPLMFVAAAEGSNHLWAVTITFSMVTIAMVVGQSLLAYAGISRIRLPWLDRYSHALAGATIALTAIFVGVLGL